ncbi:hypothetical protein MCP1_410013 [Candidatus Terasakiella magnetica]|nr:hypothetical protein MCP1_410013 [Candidatus Terasakiella magnetica]
MRPLPDCRRSRFHHRLDPVGQWRTAYVLIIPSIALRSERTSPLPLWEGAFFCHIPILRLSPDTKQDSDMPYFWRSTSGGSTPWVVETFADALNKGSSAFRT